MTQYKYPCTGNIATSAFPEYLKTELGEPRRNIQLFANELKDLFEADYLSLVNSGSSANMVAALMVRELRPKRKRVLMSGFSFPTTISSFELLGFNVELIDIQADSFNMSSNLLADTIADDVAAVVLTHFLGFAAQLQRISELCKQHGALLVQDACETMNLKIGQRSIHSYGDIITHSFYHPHHLSSYGGGAVVVNSQDLYLLMESVIHWGRACTCHYNADLCKAPANMNHNFWYERLGVNVEISELNACFGRFQLASWPAQEAIRKRQYKLLFDRLSGYDFLKLTADQSNISPFVFPIQLEGQQFADISKAILGNSIEIRTLMGGAIHLQPGFKSLNNGKLLETENLGASSFFCGIHQSIGSDRFDAMLNLLDKTLAAYV